MQAWLKKYKTSLLLSLLLMAVLYYFCLPRTLFDDPYSTVLEDRHRELLSATIAPDGQWRFPETDSVSGKFSDAIVLFEDKRFYSHPGVDLFSMARALQQNIQAGRVVSGGSTLSMQVIRLSRQGKSRTVLEKLIEAVLATRLELRYSKEEILNLYASHAPFGGNVVGIDAACWRYFGKGQHQLSWAEAALLAVLPNAPSLIHPGRNRDVLKIKRDRLLEKLRDAGKMDSLDCDLARMEMLPEEPNPLPRHARHLLIRSMNEGYGGKRVKSTLQYPLQQRIEQIVEDHHQQLKGNQIHNLAAIVISVETGAVLAYVGNVASGEDHHGDEVDVVTAPRSTGSILKPFLYAAMLNEGKMLPKTLWPDVPTFIDGFTPRNFSKDYDGAVPADKALIRSLNVPAVHMLRDYRYEKFHGLLRDMGMTTLTNPPDHYGLSLILGGAEGTLWDITGMYASMARTLNHYFNHPGANRYDLSDYHAPYYLFKEEAEGEISLEESSWLSAASIYQTFEALKEVYRPGEETGWRYFSNARQIAWKTGTSFGHRDAWAVGVTPDFAVGIWAGNADGEGRPGLTGTEIAAPVMFDIFSQLPGHRWFYQPSPEMKPTVVCKKSGYRAGEYCDDADTILVVEKGATTPACTYHRKVHLSRDRKFRVHSDCDDLKNMQVAIWFALPPVQEHYFKVKNISYKPLPPYRSDCQPAALLPGMDLVYPKPNARITIPRELDGQMSSTVFELAHSDPAATVYWHLDGEYLGATEKRHRMSVQPHAGNHILTLVDETGQVLETRFEVITYTR